MRSTPNEKICGQNDAPLGMFSKSEGTIRIFSFPTGYSIDRWRWPSSSLSVFPVSCGLDPTRRSTDGSLSPNPLFRVTDREWFPTMIYVRFSRGCLIACGLSLLRGCDALNGSARMFDSLLSQKTRSQERAMRALELFTREYALFRHNTSSSEDGTEGFFSKNLLTLIGDTIASW